MHHLLEDGLEQSMSGDNVVWEQQQQKKKNMSPVAIKTEQHESGKKSDRCCLIILFAVNKKPWQCDDTGIGFLAQIRTCTEIYGNIFFGIRLKELFAAVKFAVTAQ